jgi:hypothetical protein
MDLQYRSIVLLHFEKTVCALLFDDYQAEYETEPELEPLLALI